MLEFARKEDISLLWPMCFKMPPSQNPCRINLLGLKAKITKILGPRRASQYFGILGQFFSCKLSKAELDRQILLTVEKEYLSLHNQLIRAIWTNATSNGAPPSPALDEVSSGIQRKYLPTKATNFESSPQGPQSPSQAAPSNGFIVTVSPKKGRSGIRDRKAKEKQNMLAIHFKGEISTSQEATTDEGRGKGLDNGVVESFEITRRLEKAQDSAQRPDINDNSSIVPHAKRLRFASSNWMDLPATESADEKSPILHIRSANRAVKDETSNAKIRAPLGIPFCVGSVGAAANAPSNSKSLSLNHTLLGNSIKEESLDLPDADSLQRWMDRIAILGGLEGVSYESVVCLNQALDIHLKKLIVASIELVQSRHSRDEQGSAPLLGGLEVKRKETLLSRRLSPGLIGLWPDQSPSRFANVSLEAGKDKENNNLLIKPIDFKVAINNQPQQLGENWPTILERLSFRVFEQQDKQCQFGL